MYKEIETKPPKKKSSIYRTVVITFSFAGIFLLGLYIGNGTIQFNDGFSLKKSQQNSQLPDDLNYATVEQLYDALKKSYDGELSEEEIMDGIKAGLVGAAGDTYTEYLNNKEAKEFNESLNGTFSGIGAELSKENEAIVVVSPIAGYPAEKAGLRPKDVIVKINDESALELSVAEAVTKIRGEEGTNVKLTVVRDRKQELEFEITRAKITIPSVEYSIEDNIGYVKVSRYGDDTKELTTKAAQEFKSKNVKGVILDLRSNPGGLLDSAVDMSSLWLNKDSLVLEEKRGGEVVKSFKARGGNILSGIPTVVLIDEGSASASEITAGALKDNGVAVLYGKKTFGKGSVQQLSELRGGGVLKVTIARWYTPAGKNIDKEGIEPDKSIDRTEEDFVNKTDPQKDAAVEYLKNN
ncbi:S41 family peptidase [Candidatus Saccharibacteria bacterium]|nr:S41 family peptidase [Candidatus Saccharibacteria bacterium]